MLLTLNANDVQFMVVGAYAVTAYTSPRYTGDIDYWVNPTPENAKKVLQALRAFGAPTQDLTIKHLMQNKKAAGRPKDLLDLEALMKS